MRSTDYKKYIRNINDFPKKGIVFRDIGPLLENKTVYKKMFKDLIKIIGEKKIDKVVGIDARGFIIASVLAEKLNAGMVMLRKKGKLPYKTESIEYGLEYGNDILEIQRDSIKKGEKVLVVDDVLATGGTAIASVKLVEKLGAKISGLVFLISLNYLNGRKLLEKYKIISLIEYD